MIYSFFEAGCIPGIPGTFAGVRVEVREDGSMDVQPLSVPVVALITPVIPEIVEPVSEDAPVPPMKQKEVR